MKYDNTTGNYQTDNGDIIPRESIRDYVEIFLGLLALLFADRAKFLVENFTAENFDKWKTEIEKDVRTLHLLMTLIGSGGVNNTPVEYYLISDNEISNQITFLRSFFLGLITGSIRFDNRFIQRSSLYALAGWQTYLNTEIQVYLSLGYDEYRNILGTAEHCTECIAETNKGWVKIGSLIPIGQRTCMVKCRCRYEFRKTE